jgi:hypothetical protein
MLTRIDRWIDGWMDGWMDGWSHIPIFASRPSMNNHMEFELSRRDDLEAIAYMLIYFIKGKLPWMECSGQDNKEKNAQIYQSKLKHPPKVICSNLPKPFLAFLVRAVRS